MNIAGIISEFNPFHNGHKYIVDKIKNENDCLIAVMSGNYVQRGEPAIISKFVRAQAALKNGVDLVVELPSPWSASFAQNFAYGAVSCLKELQIDTLYFGSETDSVEYLSKIADMDENLSIETSKCETYAKTRQEAIRKHLGKKYADVLMGANDNLGIEYIKASRLLGCKFDIKTVKRIGAGHDSNITDGNICSASNIRKNFNETEIINFTPENTHDLIIDCIESGCILNKNKFSTAVISYLRRKKDFSSLPDISEGIENKLLKEIKTAKHYEELLCAVKSKRYTLARIRRLILSAFLDIDRSYVLKPVPYLNILGMTQVGEQVLKNCAKESTLPLIISSKSSKPLDNQAEVLLNKEYVRNDIFSSLLCNPLPCGTDYTNGIIKFKGEDHT